MKFKVGDRVQRIAGKHGGMVVGDFSFIVGTSSTIYIQLSGFDLTHDSKNFEVANIQDSRLARRLYKNQIKEIRDGYLIIKG